MTGPIISGHAVVFGDLAEVRQAGFAFSEVFAPTAFDGVSLKDVSLRLDHGDRRYARTVADTLRLQVTDFGLRFFAQLPNDEHGNALHEGILRGDYGGMSIRFGVAADSWFRRESDGHAMRFVERLSVLDEISVATNPCFPLTNVASGADPSSRASRLSEERKTTGELTLADLYRVRPGQPHPMGQYPMPRPKHIRLHSSGDPMPAPSEPVPFAMAHSRAAMSGYISLAESRGVTPEYVRDMAMKGRLGEVIRMPKK